MMKWSTPVEIKESSKKLKVSDRVFSMGSCFSTEMTSLLSKGQIQTLSNPFGTLFNPYSIANALERIHKLQYYTEEDLVAYGDKILSLEHHSSFSGRYAHLTLEKINGRMEEASTFLQSTSWVLLTFGSAFIYEFLPKGTLVANCHKLPSKFFNKRLLSPEEVYQSIEKSIVLLKDLCPKGVKILLSLSPVRHTKDGMVENQRSKAILLSELHRIVEQHEDVDYLPAYEILLDELRDYRYYKEDLIHPSAQAVHYIFEKFGSAYFHEKTMEFIEENFKIQKALEHRPSDEKDPAYLKFQHSLNERIEAQKAQVSHPIFPAF